MPRPRLLRTPLYSSYKTLLTILLCFCVLLATLIVGALPSGFVSHAQTERRGHPEPGPPAGTLPNLDQLRRKRQRDPEPISPVPSLSRGRRKAIVPRNGLKVGDPVTLGRASTASDTANPKPSTSGNAVARVGTRATPSGNRLKRHHLPKVSLPFSPPYTDTDILNHFFTYALTSATSTETTYWYDILRTAYVHGQAAGNSNSMVAAVRELGKTLFESATYAARGRNNSEYVYDLYQTYLMRDPTDDPGWAFWTGILNSYTREQVRRAFDESGEFIYYMGTVTTTGNPGSSVTSLLPARVDPLNQSGNQALARDAEWAVSLYSLPGRAGLDLGLGISYSSAAVWTHSGPYLYFDEDNSGLSPGFRFGFPTVQEKYFNAQTGQDAYLLITSAGDRVELRQVATSVNYHAADSSYMELVENSASAPTLLTVYATDGTQMEYSRIESEWHCTKIKDRNGNFITVNYNTIGDLSSVLDTLNRQITFNYDGYGNLASIVQNWNGGVHVIATFGWTTTTIAPSFSGAAFTGVANNQSISVLNLVGLIDGSYYKFLYNNTAHTGQVNVVERYSVDGIKRAWTTYDYDSPSNDSPRITAAHLSADAWSGYHDVPSEAVTSYAAASDLTWCKVTTPDGTIYKDFYTNPGWQRRLSNEAKVYLSSTAEASDTFERKVITAWQDDNNAGPSNNNSAYPSNPRIIETNVYDSVLHQRRTKMGYFGPFNLPEGGTAVLPSDVYEYDADATTILRRSHTDYNLTSTYLTNVNTTRRIIGLPSAVRRQLFFPFPLPHAGMLPNDSYLNFLFLSTPRWPGAERSPTERSEAGRSGATGSSRSAKRQLSRKAQNLFR